MTITALPTPPQRTQTSSEFASAADAFISALPTFVDQANALQTDVNAKQIAAAASESAAAASALSAVNAPGTSGTSVTSLAIGVGSKTLTIQTGKSIVVGMSVKIAYTATGTDWMLGDVTSYNSGTGSLTVNVTLISGSGTYAAWTVSLSAPQVMSQKSSVDTERAIRRSKINFLA